MTDLKSSLIDVVGTAMEIEGSNVYECNSLKFHGINKKNRTKQKINSKPGMESDALKFQQSRG